MTSRGLREPDDGNFAELTALIVNIVDQRAQGRDAQTARDKQMSALHFSNGNGRPKGPRIPTTSPHCILCSSSVNLPARRTHSLMKPCWKATKKWRWSFAHAEDGQLNELAGLLVECFANALVNQAELEELLGCGEFHDGSDARRPRTIGIFGHELSTRFDMARCDERRYLNRSRESMPIRHWSPPFPAGRHARRAFSRQRTSTLQSG